MSRLLKNNKKGVTLVESVLALAILALLAVAVFSLFATGDVAITRSRGKAGVYAEAAQKMDFLMAAVSDSADLCADPITWELSAEQIRDLFPHVDLYGAEISAQISLYDPDLPRQPENIRGWYLTLTYKGVTLNGFTSYGKEVFLP